MFGFFKQSMHEPVEQQRADAAQGELAGLILAGADCDEVPGAQGPLGSISNPIPVNGGIGEIKYLAKLRGATGQAVMFHRIGSVRSAVVEAPVDVYEIVCMDGTQWNKLHFDLYHPRRSNLAPPGYQLAPYDKQLKMDLPFAFGVNGLVNDFPFSLPEAIVRFYGESPGRVFARKVEERLKQHEFRRPATRDAVTAHVLDPNKGYTRETWVVGEQISEDVVSRLGENGNVFIVIAYEAGVPKKSICARPVWEKMKSQFDAIEEGSGKGMRRVMDELTKLKNGQ